MKRTSILALMACAALAIGCSSNTTPAATVALDTNTGGTDGTAGPDTTEDAGGTGTDAGTATDAGTDQKCSCAGKECGFIPDCPKSCGACGAGKACKNNTCEAKIVIKLTKFGDFCGPTKDCQPPPNSAANDSPEAKAYRECLNAQCETSLCYGNVCTKMCTILKDEKNNATGAAGDDGIEDSATNSECGDAATGENAPHGSTYACVQQLPKAQVQAGQSASICVPATDFKPCKADSDCKDVERCRLYYVYGEVTARCGPKSHTPKLKTGNTLAQSCNTNPADGDIAICENNFCNGLGCLSFCKTNDDCLTDNSTCTAGKCANGNSCKTAADCSAWKCDQQKLSNTASATTGICWPKNCEVNGDCPDETFACRISYNGVKDPKGDPDPTDATKVKLPGWANICIGKNKGGVKTGENCDPFSNDDDKSLKACENPFMCNGGTCSTLCNKGSSCPKDMKCGYSELPLDLDNPKDDIYDVYLAYGSCTSVKGAGKSCTSTKACGAGKHCKVIIEPVDLAANATPVDYKYVANGLCVDKGAGKKDFGGMCGSATTETGLGKLCNSGYCLNATNQAGQPQPGFCVDICSSKSDCAPTVKLYNQDYKSVCTSLRLSWNTTADPRDDHYIPVCMPTNKSASLADCSKDKACTKNTEACLGYAVSMSVDKPSKVEYFCSFVGNSPTQANQNPPQPTKNVGDECNVGSTLAECKTGYCMADVKTGKGYCSRVCNKDADCGSKDSMFCNTEYQRIPRLDKANAAIMPLCMKKKSCISCTYDYNCAGAYTCHNVGGGGTLAKQVCSPSCKTDADCATTDGGAKCVDSKDVDGNVITDKKVCAPSC